MPTLFQTLLGLHIAGGFTGLFCGTISIAAKKGSKLHKAVGKVFFWGMFLASTVALVLSNLPEHHNIFLFAVGGFTLYMISSGYRIVYLKRQFTSHAPNFKALDYLISLFGFCFGLFLVYLAIINLFGGNNFGLVPGAFGLICMNYARMDFKMLFQKISLKEIWLPNHITRMMGAMIASYTAFLAVNVKMQPAWVLWLLPTLIGSGLITYYLRKFAPKKSAKSV
jgi:uncharacterized membrane protein